MSISYTTGVPNPANDPSVDVGSMQINCTSISNYVAIDHIPFGVSPSGYHNVIHFQNQVSKPPAGGVKVGELYTTTNGTRLIFQNPAGTEFLLNSLISPLGNNNGYIQIPGGILLQWGVVAFSGGNSHETDTVLFATANTNFNNCYVVVPELIASGTGTLANSNTISIVSKSPTNFVWNFNSSSSTGSTQYPGFYWIAIGN